MSDENENKTAKLDELFASETDHSGETGERLTTDASAEPAASSAAPTTATTATTAATAATATLPEAEPAWLGGRGAERPVRTTPRVRWAAIIWGLVFAAAGWFTIWTLLAGERRAAFSRWVLSLDSGGWAVVGALALGALLLVIGLSQGLKAATRGHTQ